MSLVYNVSLLHWNVCTVYYQCCVAKKNKKKTLWTMSLRSRQNRRIESDERFRHSEDFLAGKVWANLGEQCEKSLPKAGWSTAKSWWEHKVSLATGWQELERKSTRARQERNGSLTSVKTALRELDQCTNFDRLEAWSHRCCTSYQRDKANICCLSNYFI